MADVRVGDYHDVRDSPCVVSLVRRVFDSGTGERLGGVDAGGRVCVYVKAVSLLCAEVHSVGRGDPMCGPCGDEIRLRVLETLAA